jgi:S-DNA-T family DNA segregation ATPase FtsK/SpoIIIE
MAVRQSKKGIRREVSGIVVIAVAILSGIALWVEPGGLFGDNLRRVIYVLFGTAASAFPIVLLVMGASMMIRSDRRVRESKIVGFLLVLLAFLALLHVSVPQGAELMTGLHGLGGGIIGAVLVWLMRGIFGDLGMKVLVGTMGLTGFMLVTELSVILGLKKIKDRFVRLIRNIWFAMTAFVYSEREPRKRSAANRKIEREPQGYKYPKDLYGEENQDDTSQPRYSRDHRGTIESMVPESKKEVVDIKDKTVPLIPQKSTESMPQVKPRENEVKEYVLPSIGLLKKPYIPRGRSGNAGGDKSRLLEETLESFGVNAKVTNISRGPVVTRYELHPAPGVKVSRVLSLADDLALSLAATDVRIEAPIPGKAAIGIEVPNEEIAVVSLREVLEVPAFAETPSKLAVGLGKDIAGAPVVSDLGKMVHLLVAGATGSGKSVCMNAIITSILFKAKPDEVKMLMIDPKVVELNNYNGIPHLAAPVVTDPKKAAGVLKWVVQEMENRYSLFASTGVREISKYNLMVRERNQSRVIGDPTFQVETTLPYILVIIDELADLMMVAAVEVEDAICRLAQMARAAGIHLVVATQRPSVDVVTGLIKANIPSRISFAVSSQVDSRTILDMAGAEKLLGRGDMLFLPAGASKPVRIQGAFISDKDIEEVVDFWKKQASPDYEPSIFQLDDTVASMEGYEDELFDKAVDLILLSNQASISLLQRRMHIGYTRAARLIDMMEDRGIVGKHEGSKAREILISQDHWERIRDSQ